MHETIWSGQDRTGQYIVVSTDSTLYRGTLGYKVLQERSDVPYILWGPTTLLVPVASYLKQPIERGIIDWRIQCWPEYGSKEEPSLESN